MGKEQEPQSKIYAQPETHQFLKAAIADGVVDRVLENKDVRLRVRNLNITGTYFASPARYQDISNIYPDFSSRERARKIVKATTRKLWENCSPEIQERFPWEKMKLGKPLSVKARQKASEKLGGRSYQVAQLVEKGYSPREILEKTGITNDELAQVRLILKNWGVDLPYLFDKEKYKKFARKLEEAPDSDTVQQLLDKVTLSFYRGDGQQEKRALIPIKEVIGEYHYRMSDYHLFVESLKRGGIPTGKVEWTIKSGPSKDEVLRYFFIARHHLTWAREILNQDTSLAHYKNLPTVLPGSSSINRSRIVRSVRSMIVRSSKALF